MADESPPRKRAARKRAAATTPTTAAAPASKRAPARSKANDPSQTEPAPTAARKRAARKRASAKTVEPDLLTTVAAPVQEPAPVATPATPTEPGKTQTSPPAVAAARATATPALPPEPEPLLPLSFMAHADTANVAPVRSHATSRLQPRPLSERIRLGGTAGLWLDRLDPWLRLCRLDRPIGTLLLLWPTWWGLWAAAEGTPPWSLLLIFTLGVILMRSAGCVINDYADRWLDPQVQRTQSRPLVTGEIAPGQALRLFFGLLLAALVLVSFTNRLTIQLACIGAVLAASYPFLKRYTHLPQLYLGVAFGWAIPMAFAAVTGAVPALAWLLFIANVLWTTAYDTWYAMVDREDDIRAGSKSTAILFGELDLTAIALMQGMFLIAMLFVGQRLLLGWPYWLALAITAALCAMQLWQGRQRDRDACFRAFLHNNRVGLVLFVGLAVGLALR